jgi:hypothetical protein
VSAHDDGLDREPCQICGRLYHRISPSMRWCRVCLHEKSRDYDLAVAELAWEHGYRLGLQRARQQLDDAGLEAALGGLPLRDLITLCHPDRHPPEREDLANRITVWLNALRDTA